MADSDLSSLSQVDEARKPVARAEVDRLEDHFRAIVENAPEEISLKDTEGRYLLVNSRFEALAGLPASEILGRTSEEVFGKDFAASGIGHDREVIRSGQASEREEVFQVGGEDRDFLTTKFPVFDDSGEVVAVGAIHVDLFQRNAVERLKSEFMAMVNHELRTPLTAIQGALKMIKTGVVGDVPETVTAMLEIANRNAERMNDLVSDLLDLSTIQAGKLSLSMATFALDELVERVTGDLAPMAHRHNIEFTVKAGDGPMIVNGDTARLSQVVTNLLSNAVRFSAPGSRVTVHVERNVAMIRVAVEDEGEGVPDDFAGDLFAPFSQADSSDTRKSGGTGLGLSISRAIVELHGGMIGYRSKQGVGSTFYFELPAASAEKEA